MPSGLRTSVNGTNIVADRAKQELESELLECERSIAMFSKPVYVDPRGGLTNNGPQEPAQAAAAYGADRWERPLQ